MGANDSKPLAKPEELENDLDFGENSFLNEFPQYFNQNRSRRSSVDRVSQRSSRVSVTLQRSLRRAGSSVHENMVNIHSDRNIRKDYDGLDMYNGSTLLGQGSWGVVRTVWRKDDPKRKYACKILSIADEMTPERLHELRREIALLSKLDHSHIVKLRETYEDEGLNLYLVMELLSGYELFDRLESDVRYTEAKARHAMKQMVGAIAYLHKKGIVHRDLKLENFIYRNRHSEEIVLIDFGLSCRYEEELGQRSLKQVVGSSYYMAPEVQDKKYDAKCDMWSLGVIAYMLLSGTPPFAGSTDKIILRRAYEGKYTMKKGTIWDRITVKAKSFIHGLLRKNPSHRLSSEEALVHPWLSDQNKDALDVPLPETVASSLKKFSHTEKFKRIAMQAVAFSAQYEDIADLHQLFEEMDTDHDGYLSLADLETALMKRGDFDSETVKNIFNAMDIDKTGEIHLNEFVAAALNENHTKDENLLIEAFDRLDIDENGEIDKEDLAKILGGKELNQKDVLEIFGKQKSITKKEFLARMRSRKKERVRTHLTLDAKTRRAYFQEQKIG